MSYSFLVTINLLNSSSPSPLSLSSTHTLFSSLSCTRPALNHHSRKFFYVPSSLINCTFQGHFTQCPFSFWMRVYTCGAFCDLDRFTNLPAGQVTSKHAYRQMAQVPKVDQSQNKSNTLMPWAQKQSCFSFSSQIGTRSFGLRSDEANQFHRLFCFEGVDELIIPVAEVSGFFDGLFFSIVYGQTMLMPTEGAWMGGLGTYGLKQHKWI